MFLQASVILSIGGGGGSASVHAGMPAPPDQADPGTRQTPPGPDRPLPGPGRSPPGSRRQHTVNERPVRILLECILVIIEYQKFSSVFFVFSVDLLFSLIS